MSASGCPPRLLSLEASEISKCITFGGLRHVIDMWNGHCGLVIFGATRCGKSLAVAQASRRVRQMVWMRADELGRALSDRGGGEIVHQAKTCKILVIDEMGWERWDDTLREVIGARYDTSSPTVITSGLTPEDFATRYTDAVLRKITEVGNGGVVNCWGKWSGVSDDDIGKAIESAKRILDERQAHREASMKEPKNYVSSAEIQKLLDTTLRKTTPPLSAEEVAQLQRSARDDLSQFNEATNAAT